MKLQDLLLAGVGTITVVKLLVDHQEFKRAEKPFRSMIDKAATTYGVHRSVLSALLYKESAFNPKLPGKTGDIGIAQFTRIAFQDNLENGFTLAKSFEDYWRPEIAIPGAAFKLRLDRKRTGSIFNAIRAYNTGPDMTVNGDTAIGLAYAGDVFRVAVLDAIYTAFDTPGVSA